MPLELWVLLALAALGAVLVAVARWRRKRRGSSGAAADNIYPLW